MLDSERIFELEHQLKALTRRVFDLEASSKLNPLDTAYLNQKRQQEVTNPIQSFNLFKKKHKAGDDDTGVVVRK